jgi:hypothetical protein
VTDRHGRPPAPRLALACLGVALALTIVGPRPGDAPPRGGPALRAALGALGHPVEVAGLPLTAGQVAALLLTGVVLVPLAGIGRRARTRPVATDMGFGAFRPEAGEWPGDLPPGPAASGGTSDPRPLVGYLWHEARVAGLLAAACVAAALALVYGTSAADPARYPGRIWETAYPGVLAGSGLLLAAAGLYAVRRAAVRRGHARLAVALAAPLDREALELEVADVEERVLRRAGGRPWPLVAAAVLLYLLAAAGPFAPAPALPWPPWSALPGGGAPPGR